MADKYEQPPQYPPPAQQNYNQNFQSPPPQMSYDPNYQQQQQYEMNRGNQGSYGAPPQQGYYGGGPGYGPPQGWNGQQQPNVVYERDRGSGGGGICAGLFAALACCCCLDCLF